MPKDVRVQCSGFSGLAVAPTAAATDLLSGCTSRNGKNGSGAITRTAGGGTTPQTETITWNKPFERGKSFLLASITSAVVGQNTGCPADHPVEVLVMGTIAPNQEWAGSPVTASICTNGADFIEKPGTFFMIKKVSESVS